MISSSQVDIIISIMIFFEVVFLFKKLKIHSLLVKNYENRNFQEDLKLQKIQDEYYAHKKQVNELHEQINEIKHSISQLDQWFEKEKELIERNRTRLKRQKHEDLCRQYKKKQIIHYIKDSLIKSCEEQVLNSKAIKYSENLETTIHT